MNITHVTATAPPSLDEVRQSVADIMGVSPTELADDSNLLALGLDSLGVMRLVNGWRKFGIRVSSRNLTAEPTLVAWHRHLTALYRDAVSEQWPDQPAAPS